MGNALLIPNLSSSKSPVYIDEFSKQMNGHFTHPLQGYPKVPHI
jgi:hypothetical protein